MFIYLSKKIAIPNGVQLKCASWNGSEGWIACGGDNGLLKVLKLDGTIAKGGQQSGNLSMNQTLEGHSGSVMVVDWNPYHRKLTTSDQYGLIIVWMLHKGMWFEEMINNRNKSVVRDMKWSADGQKICIAYEDGAVIVGSVDGKRLLGKEVPLQLALVEWSPDGRLILFCTVQGECHIYDGSGNPLSRIPLAANEGLSSSPVIGVDWYSGKLGRTDDVSPTLAIGFENGNVQLMRGESDERPVVLKTGLRASRISWSSSGSVLAVAGLRRVVEGRDVNTVHFYSPLGNLLCILRVPGSNINAMTWEGNDLRVALAVDSYIYFANIRPDYKWGFFGNTLVYAFQKPDKTETCVVFWDVERNQRCAKYVKRLLAVRAAGDSCVLVTRGEMQGQFILILCNSIGSPIDSKYIEIEPLSIAMTAAHVIVASRSSVYIWNHLSQNSTFSRAGAVPSDEDRVETSDNVFHIHNRSPYDERSNIDNTPLSSSATTGDPICSVAASDNILLVGLQSGVINQYNLRQLSLDCQHLLKCRPRMMSLNCVSTSFSVIDMNGTLTVYDITASSKDSSHPLAASEIKFERKDVWDMRWSEDDPELFALMEKTRMYIFRGTEPEEPVLSSAYICEFRNLQIKAVLLDDIMQYPEKQIKEYVINFETKSLRDTRNLLQNVSMQDAYQFVEDNSHPRLWHLLAEHALDKLNLVIAEKAFVQCSDYHGIQFVKQLQTCDDVLKQQAQIASYFKRFDDAEKLYAELDRSDLAIEMRMHLGDWFKVEKLVQVGAGDDNTLTLAWNNIGHYFADRKKWSKAVAYFAKAKNVEKLADCFYALEDFLGLDKLVNMVPEGHVLLRDVAKKFVGVGLCESAVKAYLRAGDVKAAIDSCVILNQWDKAVELAERHNFQQIEALLGKYAGHLLEEQQVIGAIDLFRKANKHTEVASLLTKLAKSVATSKGPVIRAKKLHVLAALEATKFRHRALVSEMPNVTRGVRRNERTVAAQTLDGLMTLDQVASENSAIEGSWRGAEAFHFLLLAHRQLFDGQFEYARRTSLLLQDFEDLLDSVEIYSLIAITSYFSRYYGRCSKAFVKLESAPDNTKAKMAAYKKLATAVFLKHQPIDPGSARSMKKSTTPTSGSAYSMANVCVASGRRIGASDSVSHCKTCNHKSIVGELRGRVTCPLCHARSVKVATSQVTTPDDLVEGEVSSPTAPSRREI